MSEPLYSRPPRVPIRTTVQPAAPEAVEAARARVAQVSGGELVEGDYGWDCLLAAPPESVCDGFVAPLTDLSVLTVTGADAVPFLHAQLTSDVEQLDADAARLAGYCSPKGRLLATFTLWRHADAVGLVGAQPRAAALSARLGLYVLRAKALVRDDAARAAVIGAAGRRGAQALAALGIEPPAPLAVHRLSAGEPQRSGQEDIAAIGLPAAVLSGAAQPRWLVVLPLERLDDAWARLAGCAPVAGSDLWRFTEVLSGVPRIVGGAVEQFVPQMVNLELSGGVDFRKGCYPGQEVVARSQYLGKLRRRMFAAQVDAQPPAPGADVLADGVAEPVGQVVLAAADPAGGAAVLFEALLDRVHAGTLRLAASGAPLRLRELPYALPS